jgi:hypothetical protein
MQTIEANYLETMAGGVGKRGFNIQFLDGSTDVSSNSSGAVPYTIPLNSNSGSYGLNSLFGPEDLALRISRDFW